MTESILYQLHSEAVRHLTGLNIYWLEESEAQVIKIL